MRIARLLVIVLFSFFFVSCESNSELLDIVKPTNLISEQKFIEVFSDIVLLEVVASQQSSNIFQAKKIMKVSSSELLEKHHVNKKQFNESFEYYNQDKEKMLEIYSKIIEEYNIRLSRIE